MMAYITRYLYGTDKLRPHAFEVRGIGGGSTGVVHCPDAAVMSHWIKHITNNIIGLTNLQVGNIIGFTYLQLVKYTEKFNKFN